MAQRKFWSGWIVFIRATEQPGSLWDRPPPTVYGDPAFRISRIQIPLPANLKDGDEDSEVLVAELVAADSSLPGSG